MMTGLHYEGAGNEIQAEMALNEANRLNYAEAHALALANRPPPCVQAPPIVTGADVPPIALDTGVCTITVDGGAAGDQPGTGQRIQAKCPQIKRLTGYPYCLLHFAKSFFTCICDTF